MDDDEMNRLDGDPEDVPFEDPGPVDPTPGPSEREDDAASASEHPSKPERAEDRPARASEAGEGAIEPEPETLENLNHDELLERAGELGLNVEPELDREELIAKLARHEGPGQDRDRDNRTTKLGA